MSSNMTVEDKIFQWASSNYLTEQMDDEVVISDDETDEFMIAWIDDHKLEENAYQQAGYILNDIAILADAATRFFKSIREEL